MDDTGIALTMSSLRDDGLLYNGEDVGSQNVISYFWDHLMNYYENYFRAIGQTIEELDAIGIR